ncbi:TrkH family potassium uptake protein [Caenispirillum salinarum]|uniref:TrkH family potassium uptake protein n=1 Tax=Caenispirillum salinarum TaxID=859058 RepID=UPI00384C176E
MAGKGAAVLARPVRPRMVAACFAALAPSLALAPGVPVPVALLLRDWETAVRCAVPVVLLLGFWALGRRWSALTVSDVQRNEALLVSGLSFIAASAALAWPLKPQDVPWDAAIFEAVSAITSTGLTMFPEPSVRSPALLFVRAWGQWYGGLAILVLALSLTVRPGVLSRRLGRIEASESDFIGGTRARAKRVLWVYGALTVACIATLWPLTGSVWEALLHGLTAVSTAGFSSHGDSLAGWDWPARAAIMVFALAGAVSLLFWWRLREDGPHHLLKDREAQALVVLIVGGAALIALLEAAWREGGIWAVDWTLFGHALFLSASAQTTTGYSTLDPGQMAPAAQLVMMAQMMVGADLGSTGGGLKVARVLVLAAIVRSALLATALPRHAVSKPRTHGGPVHEGAAQTAMLLGLLYGATILVGWGVCLAADAPPMAALFDVVSATSTVGLSAGVTGLEAPTAVKATLIVCMLLGRVEFLALLIALAPRTWKGG